METVYRHIPQGLEPLFDGASRVLVLGSFPSALSRADAFYYGNPQNRFWRTAASCLGEPVPASHADKRALLLSHGIALWDVIERCDIRGSRDASIRNAVPVRIELVTGAAPIEAVICNGGLAGRLYRRHLQARTGMPAQVLPSTSPANAAWSLDRLIGCWGSCLHELGIGR